MVQKLWSSFILLLLFYNSLAQSSNLTTPEREMLSFADIVDESEVYNNKIISASRSFKNEEELPLTIYVIEREEIQKNGYTTLVDALKSLPGIRVSQPGSGEDGETFLMRGFIGNFYTKILVNNIPVQPSVLAGFPIAAQLPIRQAERIEVIYGPSAAVYGADAASGVINIITHQSDMTAFADADIVLGEYGYQYLNFTAGGKAGRNKNILHYTLYGSSSSRNDLNIWHNNPDLKTPFSFIKNNLGYFDFGDGQIDPMDITDAVLSSYNTSADSIMYYNGVPNYEGSISNPAINALPQSSRMIGVELNFRGLKLGYNDMYRQDHSSLGRSVGVFLFNNSANFWGENIKRLTLSFDKKFGQIGTTTNLSYLRYRLNNNSSLAPGYGNDPLVYQYSASDDLFAEQLLTYSPSEKLELLAGASFQFSGNLPKTNDLISPFDTDEYEAFSQERLMEPHPDLGYFGYNPLRYSNTAVFLQAYYNSRKFTFMGGLRHDYNSLYGNSTNPRFAALYKINNITSIRFSMGTAFRTPTTSLAYQSVAYYNDDPVIDTPGYFYAIVPNPDLKPEIFESYEIGIIKQFNKNIRLDISGYFNQIENLISTVFTEFDQETFASSIVTEVRQNVNSGDATSNIFAVQSNLTLTDIIAPIGLTAEINAQFSSGNEILPYDSSRISEFRLMPRWMGQFNLQLQPVRNLYLRFESVYMGSWLRRYIPEKQAYNDPYFRTPGYFTLDAIGRYQLSDQVSMMVKVINLFNREYAGIDATGTDIDMPYNPQLMRNIQFGINFSFN